MRCRLWPSHVCRSSARVAIARNFRPHRGKHALPGEAEYRIREMELCAGQEAPVRAKINRDPVAQCPTEPCTPGLGGFLRQRRCGHHRKLCPVDKLVCESFSFCLRQVSQVLLDACEPNLGAQLLWHLGEQPSGDVSSEIESSPLCLDQGQAALVGE